MLAPMRAVTIVLTLVLSSGASADPLKDQCLPARDYAGVYKSGGNELRLFAGGNGLVGDFKFPTGDGFVDITFDKADNCNVRGTWRKKGTTAVGRITELTISGNTVTVGFAMSGSPTEKFVGRR